MPLLIAHVGGIPVEEMLASVIASGASIRVAWVYLRTSGRSTRSRIWAATRRILRTAPSPPIGLCRRVPVDRGGAAVRPRGAPSDRIYRCRNGSQAIAGGPQRSTGPGSLDDVLVTVRLFATLRERAGRNSVELRLPDGATVSDALRALSDAPGLVEPLARLPVRLAVNRDYPDPETPLSGGDELALVPPVNGGARMGEAGGLDGRPRGAGPDEPPDGRARVSEEPLSEEATSHSVVRRGAETVTSSE